MKKLRKKVETKNLMRLITQIHAGITIRMNEFGRKLLSYSFCARFIQFHFFVDAMFEVRNEPIGETVSVKNSGLFRQTQREKMIIVIKCVCVCVGVCGCTD